jgi:hypothetical protein
MAVHKPLLARRQWSSVFHESKVARRCVYRSQIDMAVRMDLRNWRPNPLDVILFQFDVDFPFVSSLHVNRNIFQPPNITQVSEIGPKSPLS